MSNLVEQWLQLHLAVGVGSITFHRLVAKFGNAQRVLDASISQLEGIDGIGRVTSEQIYQSLREIDVAGELARVRTCGAEVIPMFDQRYPRALAAITDPPPVLYVKGTLDDRDALSLAIVGTRRCSRYGSEQAYRFGQMLGQLGFTIVSGLARGIDAAAHRGALVGKGRTVAVLGCGLGQLYPSEHGELAQQIIDAGGAVVSELPIDTPPNSSNFPPRNRIIAGWSLGTLVVESPLRSGALITGRLAIEYNREVFALPGQVDRYVSAGTNAMIRDGQAKLVTCVEDILDELGQVGESLKGQASPGADARSEGHDDQLAQTLFKGLTDALNEPQRLVWEALAEEQMDPDTLCRSTGLAVAAVNTALTGLQLRGLIKHLPGNQFVRKGR